MIPASPFTLLLAGFVLGVAGMIFAIYVWMRRVFAKR